MKNKLLIFSILILCTSSCNYLEYDESDFTEKAKAIITAKYYEGLKDAFLRKKGVQVYETYKYKDCFIFGSGSFNEEFTEWAYSDADMEIKNEIYRNTYIHVLKMPPKENCIVNMADIRPF